MFAYITIHIGSVKYGNACAYRGEVFEWNHNSLELNMIKTLKLDSEEVFCTT